MPLSMLYAEVNLAKTSASLLLLGFDHVVTART